MRQYLAFVVTVNLGNNRVRAIDPGTIIHAADAELALQEAKMHIPLKIGQSIAVVFIRNLTPNDLPDRYGAVPRELIPDLTA